MKDLGAMLLLLKSLKKVDVSNFFSFFIMIKTIFVLFTVLIFGSFFVITSDAFPSSLKDQLIDPGDPDNYFCWNMDQLLVERPNGKYACVFPYTAIKLDWIIMPNEYLKRLETKNGEFVILTHASRGSITDVSLNSAYPGIDINLSTVESGKLSIVIFPKMMEDTENCLPQLTYPNYDDFFVLSNGVEVAYTERITTETLRYLEIPYDANSTNIEIIGDCLI